MKQLTPISPIARWDELPRTFRPHRGGSLIVVCSGFERMGLPRCWLALSQRHQVIAVKVTDPREWELADLGYVRFLGWSPQVEKHQTIALLTGSTQVADAYRAQAVRDYAKFRDICQEARVLPLSLSTNQSALQFWQSSLPLLQWPTSRENPTGPYQ